MTPAPRYWAVVPAAGVGRRMGAEVPKQYLPLGSRTVLAHTIEALYADERIQAVCVVLAEDDPYWPTLELNAPRALLTAAGGAARSDSVLNGIEVLREQAAPEDWVLVHDAARPCLRATDLRDLLDTLAADPVGGLLAVPTRDTMKQIDTGGRVVRTLDRSRMWHALTPQMFRVEALFDALTAARRAGLPVTDEASAMEYSGVQPRVLEAHADNIKITRPEDLALAEFFLQRQERL